MSSTYGFMLERLDLVQNVDLDFENPQDLVIFSCRKVCPGSAGPERGRESCVSGDAPQPLLSFLITEARDATGGREGEDHGHSPRRFHSY